MLLLGEKRRCIFIVTVYVVLSCSAQPEQDKFAGNLNQDISGDSVSETLVTGSNLTGHDDVVHIVRPSVDTPSNHVESEDGPTSKSTSKKKPQKAPRPIGKPDSVGFVPPPEEESVHEKENLQQVPVEKEKVHLIPTLPPRFACVHVITTSLMV